METTSEDPDLSAESRQGYYGQTLGNGNAALLNNMYGNLNQVGNNRYINGQNSLGTSWANNGLAGNRFMDQTLSKRRFANTGRFGNGGDVDYPSGAGNLGNGGGLTGAGADDIGLNGITSTGVDQTQSQDYLDSYNQLVGANFPTASGTRMNGVGGQGGGLGVGSFNANNNNLLVGNRRQYSANQRNGIYGGGGGIGNGGNGVAGLTGYGGANGAYGQGLAGIRSSGYGGGSGYGGSVI